MNLRWLRVHCWTLLAGAVCVFLPKLVLAEELPADLQTELQELRGQIARIEARMTRIAPDKTEQSIREVAVWVDEFSLDAELLDDNPLLLELKKQVDELREKAKTAAATQKANPGMIKEGAKDRMDVSGLTKVKVDLSNVSFKKDVAPILAEVCMRCHNPQRKSGDFDASTYNAFISMIEPGNPENSHVLNLVTGKAEPRMPRGGQTTFTQEWIDIWTAWIKQGAKFDGSNKGADITSYMIDLDTQRRQAIAALSTEDLEKLHRAEGQRHIDIVSPKKPVHFYETPNVLLYTTLSESDAEYSAWLAEAVLEELKQAFGSKSGTVFRGKLGVTVFADRFDYIAFSQEVDGYSPEPGQNGHFRLRPEYQYVAVAADQEGYELDGAIAQQVTSAFLGQLGNRRLPPWANYGFARSFASEMEGRNKSTVFRDELKTAGELAASGRNLLPVFTEQAAWVEIAPLSASFFEFARKTEKKKTIAFLKAYANSGNLAAAIKEGFSASPEQVSQAWLNWMRTKRS